MRLDAQPDAALCSATYSTGRTLLRHPTFFVMRYILVGAFIFAATSVAAQRWQQGAPEWRCGQDDFKNGKAPPQITLKGVDSLNRGWIKAQGIPYFETSFSLNGLQPTWRWVTGSKNSQRLQYFKIFPNGTAEFGYTLGDEEPHTFVHCTVVEYQ